MRRRKFIALIGGAATRMAACCTCTAPANASDRLSRSRSSAGHGGQSRRFSQGTGRKRLRRRQELAFEYRWAENQNDRLPGIAAELVRRPSSIRRRPAVPPRRLRQRLQPPPFRSCSRPARPGRGWTRSRASIGPAATSPAQQGLPWNWRRKRLDVLLAACTARDDIRHADQSNRHPNGGSSAGILGGDTGTRLGGAHCPCQQRATSSTPAFDDIVNRRRGAFVVRPASSSASAGTSSRSRSATRCRRFFSSAIPSSTAASCLFRQFS